jgi:hypothetical protein
MPAGSNAQDDATKIIMAIVATVAKQLLFIGSSPRGKDLLGMDIVDSIPYLV